MGRAWIGAASSGARRRPARKTDDSAKAGVRNVSPDSRLRWNYGAWQLQDSGFSLVDSRLIAGPELYETDPAVRRMKWDGAHCARSTAAQKASRCVSHAGKGTTGRMGVGRAHRHRSPTTVSRCHRQSDCPAGQITRRPEAPRTGPINRWSRRNCGRSSAHRCPTFSRRARPGCCRSRASRWLSWRRRPWPCPR
jgi:hypothetical protein